MSMRSKVSRQEGMRGVKGTVQNSRTRSALGDNKDSPEGPGALPMLAASSDTKPREAHSVPPTVPGPETT